MDELPLDEQLGAAGYRLDHVEVLGWGTFDRAVWRFDLDGHTSLLTGDIGSGKSTLVDAITTLLLPAHRISYNKAAGAETRERSLRSYVLGYWKSERSETTGVSRPVGLRDHTSHSAILAVFRNERLGSAVTLAQVFWIPDDHAGQPNRFYVVADRELGIVSDLSDFGTDVTALKKRLRGARITPHNSFPDYERAFRRALGIPSSQAMELFHQTVSMKSVGNLTDFVRAHMLEPFDAAADVRKLIGHFEDLTAAHDAVIKARTQLAALDPIVASCDEVDRIRTALTEATTAQQALRYAAATVTLELLADEVVGAEEELAGERDAHTRAQHDVETLRAEQQGLRDARAGHAGGRVGALEEARERHTAEREARAKRHRVWSDDLAAAGLEQAAGPDEFTRVRREALDAQAAVDDQSKDVGDLLTEHAVERHGLRGESDEIRAELISLRERRSSIPRELLGLRDRLCEESGVPDDRVPFVGELVQVRPGEDRWRGAAERVLRGFALSLIVDDADYGRVAGWVDSHHLGTRLVYHRVRVSERHQPAPPTSGTLAAKLELRESPYAAWLAAELAARAAHECVESLDDFRRVSRAVTVRGQVKSGSRHEKDDRRAVDDRSTYVLGWDNKAKQDALIERGTRVQEELNNVDEAIRQARARQNELQQRRDALKAVLFVDDVRDLDWWASARALHEVERGLALLVEASGELAEIEARLAVVEAELATAEEQRGKHERALGALEGRLGDLEAQRVRNTEVLARVEEADRPAIDRAAATMRSRGVRRVDAVQGLVDELRAELVAQGDSLSNRLRNASIKTVRLMEAFRRDHPAETTDMDASIEAAAEFREFRERVARDDLPRFEADFKRYLNQNTIREIAGFQTRLNQQSKEISERIRVINASLRDIDYNTDRFIRLDAVSTPLSEVREFRAQLRACTEGALLGGAADDLYSEEKFEQVRELIARFKGREGFAEHDRQWTARVTDVRNWFVFNASERWRETDQEHETYADSDGKSGGQKEKLAYTILAASLAYQFRLDAPGGSGRTFRFAVIDEAFGRGSDESTRFALRLFARLGLQLLVVTPLQKVHTIEPFVRRVGFVDNPGGRSSRLHNLTIEQYQQERAGAALIRAGERQS
ncbi:MAG TPA: SbcC/MukB-like Walker B domain-containing protein [Intrasporangium sp.]|uniref:ATP-binding protein n=1 Tax=Intrasporangium sp. TaxID=1925024 RepID=UPI002B464FEA|nr:SbcC/MukB-like Walker B domain-containing protein [Intrasporangium sp.]HKX66007.1 SbcC/MukB-like Walker B domain-containing protein [Intrasporangium sp.]